MYKKGGYDLGVLVSGAPSFGGSISQYLYYTRNPGIKSLQNPHIAMVDFFGSPASRKCRGYGSGYGSDCPSLAEIVRSVQRDGAAAAVVVVDDNCQCSSNDDRNREDACCRACKNTTTLPTMTYYNENAADIYIPAFVIAACDAFAMKREMMAEKYHVQLEVTWSLPSPGDDRVMYQVFSSPNDPFSSHFFEQFKPIAKSLGSRAYFTPSMYIHDGTRMGCTGQEDTIGSDCYKLCANHGRYCAPHLDNYDYDSNQGISGFDVVRESLRRLIIWQLYGANDGVGVEYWDYVTEFNNRCSTEDYFATKECIQNVYKHAMVDGNLIEQTMQDSGDLKQDRANPVLDAAIETQTQLGVFRVPTVYVNGVALSTTMCVSSIFEAICQAYKEESKPEVCKSCGRSSDPIACVENYGHSCGTDNDGGARTSFSGQLFSAQPVLLVSAMMAVSLVVGCFLLAKRVYKNKMLPKPQDDGDGLHYEQVSLVELNCLDQ